MISKKDWITVYKLKGIAKAQNVHTSSFWHYLMSICTFLDPKWHGDAPLWAVVLYRNTGLLSLRQRSQWGLVSKMPQSLLYLLNCWSFGNLTFFGGTAHYMSVGVLMCTLHSHPGTVLVLFTWPILNRLHNLHNPHSSQSHNHNLRLHSPCKQPLWISSIWEAVQIHQN